MAKSKIIRDYLIGSLLTLSIFGIPLVLGYLNRVVSNKIRAGDDTENSIIVGSYAPIIDRFISGIMMIIFVSLPFASIFFVQGVYAWSLSTEVGSISYVQTLSSILAVILSLLCTYMIPFFITVQAYRTTYSRTFDEVLFEFIIPNLYSWKYMKYFIVFVILTIGFSSLSYAGTLSLIFYFFAIIMTPIYMIGVGNIVGSGAYKIKSQAQ